jgi:hypothetical protein
MTPKRTEHQERISEAMKAWWRRRKKAQKAKEEKPKGDE